MKLEESYVDRSYDLVDRMGRFPALDHIMHCISFNRERYEKTRDSYFLSALEKEYKLLYALLTYHFSDIIEYRSTGGVSTSCDIVP